MPLPPRFRHCNFILLASRDPFLFLLLLLFFSLSLGFTQKRRCPSGELAHLIASRNCSPFDRWKFNFGQRGNAISSCKRWNNKFRKRRDEKRIKIRMSNRIKWIVRAITARKLRRGCKCNKWNNFLSLDKLTCSLSEFSRTMFSRKTGIKGFSLFLSAFPPGLLSKCQ